MTQGFIRSTYFNRLKIGTILCFFLFFAILTTSGIINAHLKNENIEIKRMIESTKKEITMYKNEAYIAEAEISELLGYFPVMAQLKENSSNLVSLSKLPNEEINASRLLRNNAQMASVHPKPSETTN